MAEQVLENLNSHGTWIENPKAGRILIVDDQEANVALLERILADAGYEKTYATTDGRAVVRLCQQIQPDLIVLDLHMPFLNGFEVIKQIREWFQPQSYLPIL